ncbi:MAG: hypothetical protein RR982_01385 [Kiritimatiellia bacterium]
MKTILHSVLFATLLLCGCATSTLEYEADKAAIRGEVLSTHKTDAIYRGTQDQPCRHLTSLCPNRCDHGGKLAKFDIVRYSKYERPGQYGDPRQKQFLLRVAHKDGTPDESLPLALRETLSKLTVGQRVELSWKHVYVTDANGSKFPERIITELETEED